MARPNGKEDHIRRYACIGKKTKLGRLYRNKGEKYWLDASGYLQSSTKKTGLLNTTRRDWLGMGTSRLLGLTIRKPLHR